MTIREASTAVIEKIAEFWDKARIPMGHKNKMIEKFEAFYREYQLLKKGRGRRSVPQVTKENAFKDDLKNLMDMANANALSLLNNQEDREFLLAQREPGRRGTMGSVDKILSEQEDRSEHRRISQAKRRERSEEEASTLYAAVQLESSGSSSGNEELSKEGPCASGRARPPSPKRHKRATKNIITSALAGALDRTKVSDRKAVFVISETSRALGHDIEELNINRSSIRRERMKQRAQVANKLKAEFETDVPLIVHWDGKLMQDLTTKTHIDRLPIIVSGLDIKQMLKVAKLPNGTGKSQANAVVLALEEWGLTEKVVGMSFDTTASNTGLKNGACILIEAKLEKDLLYFACRHHMLELVIEAVFSTLMGPSQSPDILLFKRFQSQWEFIDKSQFQTGVEDDEAVLLIGDYRMEILDWAKVTLEKRKELRDDYHELLEISIIFLGEVPSRGIHFQAPGPMHRARWMAKVIYSMKTWMFRSQFKLTTHEERGLRNMCIFTVKVYLKAWMEASFPTSAPGNDLRLLKMLQNYHDKKIGTTALNKLSGHLWYLSEELIALAFFDKEVSDDMKRLMVLALSKNGDEEPPKRAQS